MPATLRRVVAPILLAAFAALALTALVVALAPGAFFRLTTEEGVPVREVSFPGPVALIGLVLVAAALFTGAFLWLRRTPNFPLVAVVVAVAGVQAAAYTSYQLWEYHESPEFCVRTCHVMEPTYLTFAESGDNLVMEGHVENGTAACLDCHTGPGVEGQVDLMVTSARHIWKYTITGDYDPKNLGGNNSVGTVPDENCIKCHQDGLKGELPEKHERFDEQCALCHSPHDTNATGYAFPESLLKVDDCSKCHREAPLDFILNPTGHSVVADSAEGCRDCHDGHGSLEKNPEAIKGCTDSGCHDQDLQNNASLPVLKHLTFEEDQCDTCHGDAHDLQPLKLDALRDACTDCHEDQKLFDDPVGKLWDVHVNVTNLYSPHANATGDPVEDCTACHGTSPPIGQPSDLGSHGGPRCASCHKTPNLVGAPPLSFTATAQSQVSWQRQNGKDFANWTEVGRGSHDIKSDCGDCHKPHEGPTPVFPEGQNATNCNSACHAWLQFDIDQPGFNGLAARTVYRGPIDPATLLEKPGNPHLELYDDFGCTGFCHNPEMNLEKAEAWADNPFNSSDPFGIDPALNATTTHGIINQCTDCHRYASPFGGPDDLHTTHIPFVQAEKPASDPGGPDEACNYCHDSGPYPENQSGGCYNCHLSGHDPETAYWGQPTRDDRPRAGHGGRGPGRGDGDGRTPVARRVVRSPLHGGDPPGLVRVVLPQPV